MYDDQKMVLCIAGRDILQELAPSGEKLLPSTELFERFRNAIEVLASAKYDAGDLTAERYVHVVGSDL